MEKLLQDKKIAVIGAGAAGVMAVIRAALNNDSVTLFPGNGKSKKKSRALWVSKIENIPGFFNYKKGIEDPHREALAEIQKRPMGKNIIVMKGLSIDSIAKLDDQFELTDSKGGKHIFDFVILATGIMDIQPIIQGSIDKIFPFANSQQIDYCIRCDGHKSFNKKTAVIGHSESAAWVSIMLYERYRHPYMSILTNGQKAKWSAEVQAILDKYGIETFEAEISEFKSSSDKALLEGAFLEDGNLIEFEHGFVSLGIIAYNQLALDVGAKVDERGLVLTNEKGESSVNGLYVVGDLRAGIKKQVYTAWDSAVDSADSINNNIRQFNRRRF